MHPEGGALHRLLVVAGDAPWGAAVAALAARLGYDAERVVPPEAAARHAASDPEYAVVLVAACSERVRQHDPGALNAISDLSRASSRSQIVLMIAGDADLDTCCRAIEDGASGFIELQDGCLDEQTFAQRLAEAVQRFERAVEQTAEFPRQDATDLLPIVGQSRPMAEVLGRAGRAAQVSDAPVLIEGESGTGKQLVAEMIHRLDPKRAHHPFVTVNCASIAGTLAESALFGHVRGAYTGATEPRSGYFRAADRGTILLDEIGDLDQALQPKLLRTLQNGVVMPVGSDRELTVDVRVIAATNQRLAEMVKAQTFRLDLYQRLNVIQLEIPPLRDRPEDIEALVPYFVRRYEEYYGKRITRIDPRVYEFLSTCSLEGNVRELENTIRRILAMKTSGDELLLTDLPTNLRRQRTGPADESITRELVEHACRMIERGQLTLPEFIAECERQVLAATVRKSKAPADILAHRLGLSRRTYYNKRRKYGI